MTTPKIETKPLDPKLWQTYDNDYAEYLKRPLKYKAKEGGAKQGGIHTGVYTFKGKTDSDNALMMLIKQGDSLGETIAEYVGGNLYQLTISNHAAKAILVRDNLSKSPSAQDVYVTSIYEQGAGNVQDAYKIAGYKERPRFARVQHALKKAFGYEDESLMRKILIDDQTMADNSLGYIIANVLWHGDHDVHMGNFVRIEKDGGVKYSKIDHGFSFFNFDKEIVDIFDPLGGKKVDVSLKRAFKGGKFVEWYPFNHFWDLAAEKKGFYFSGPFITGCEDIASLDIDTIKKNIHTSLITVKNIYANQSNEALIAFAKRMGMNKKELYGNDASTTKKDPEKIIRNIEDFMIERLKYRQASLNKLAQNCRKGAAKLTDEHHVLSREIGKIIIEKLDKIIQINTLSKTTDLDEHKTLYHKEKQALEQEIDFLKLLEQANDLGYLTAMNGKLIIFGEFNYLNAGKKQRITPAIFEEKLKSIVHFETYITDAKAEQHNKIPLSTRGQNMLARLATELPRYKQLPASRFGIKAKIKESKSPSPITSAQTILPQSSFHSSQKKYRSKLSDKITNNLTATDFKKIKAFTEKITCTFSANEWKIANQDNITSLQSKKNPDAFIEIENIQAAEVIFSSNAENCIEQLVKCAQIYQENVSNDNIEYDIFAENTEIAEEILKNMLQQGIKKGNIGSIEINGISLDNKQILEFIEKNQSEARANYSTKKSNK
ncbi:hypothetical protein CC99x_004740 [Candidatus Berkiella cookevillensis]|uniref:LepB N-terminal domain-containing protein n=1 Tax=Candidatus Berkiella cookevillensis TaxID=437022 RepID=A0A0Q9YKC3_9GAMM|nr:hypothetical protein [Candidatus Berkiella cookevillensis]MCS5708206.1 hypothetical protein [Candidatus Berkiella cookevillensis]